MKFLGILFMSAFVVGITLFLVTLATEVWGTPFKVGECVREIGSKDVMTVTYFDRRLHRNIVETELKGYYYKYNASELIKVECP